MTHEVEAENWDLALEAVLRNPLDCLAAVAIKPVNKRKVHVAVGQVYSALEVMRQQALEKAANESR